MTEFAMLASLAATSVTIDYPVPFREITWHSFDLKSGRRGSKMVTRTLGQVSRILNEPTEASIDVQIPDEVELFDDWEASTKPSTVMLVALDENESPIWGGMVFRRVTGPEGWATLSLVTLESYLDRRFINASVTYTNEDQISVIAAGVIQQTIDGPIGSGIEFTLDTPWSNWLRDRTYLVDDDKTVFSVLTELAGVENGIEFTVDLGWHEDDDGNHILLDRIIRVRNRVGTAYTGSVGTESDKPIAVFHMHEGSGGSVVDFTYLEDYSSENGANAVLATSSGEGDTRPESSLFYDVEIDTAGWAMFEHRFEPSTSIIETDTLDNHARRMLAEMAKGLNELTLEAHLDTAPKVGTDWFLGDDVAVSLTGKRFPERTNSDGEVVPGYQANARVIGWELDFDERRVRPRLLETHEVEVESL